MTNRKQLCRPGFSLFWGLLYFFAIPAIAGAEDVLSLSVPEAVSMTIKRNPAVQGAGENVLAAQQEVNSSRADLLPKISLGYGYTSLANLPIMKTEGGDRQISHQRPYHWDVTLVQPLFAGFALSSRLSIAKLEVLAKEFEKKQAEIDLARYAKGACYALLLAQKLVAVSESEVAALKTHQRNATLFYQQGLIPPNDQLKAEVALAGARQKNEVAKADAYKARIRLNRMLHRPLAAPLKIKNKAEIPPQDFVLDDLKAAALKSRPALKLIRTGLEKLGLAKKMAKSGWYPKVSLVGSLTHTGRNLTASENDYNDDDGSFVAVKLDWDIWQSGKTRAEVNKTRHQLKALEAKMASVKTEVLEEVHTALSDCRVAFTNIDIAQKALAQARENWRITDLQYEQQLATSADVLDARDFITKADTSYYRAVYGYLDAIARLEQAVGKAP